MSSRALRRMMREEDVEEEEEEEQVIESRQFNAFDMLGESDQESSEEEEDEEESVHDQQESTDEQELLEQTNTDIEQLLKEFQLTPQQQQKQKRAENTQTRSLFLFTPRNFNFQAEIRSVFGSDALQEEKVSLRRSRNPRERVLQAQIRHRRNLLASPEENWAYLSPAEVKELFFSSSPATGQFMLEYSDDYQRQQQEFHDCVDTMNPQAIVFHLSRYPFHLDALVQMSEVYRLQGDMELASECISKAVYRIDCSLPFDERVVSGGFRLDYGIEKHRSVFFAIYRHVQNLSRKGCPKTALEFAKFLLCLSPEEDPLCALFQIDFLALKSRDYEFLLDFAQRFSFKPMDFQTPNELVVSENVFYSAQKSVLLLPNFAYSVALAKYLHSSETNTSDFEDLEYFASPRNVSALDLLKYAILLFPEVVEPLLKKADARRMSQGGWACLSHRFFVEARINLKDNKSLGKLVELFVERNHVLWKGEDIFTWFNKACKEVVEYISEPSDVTTTLQQIKTILYSPGSHNRYSSLRVDQLSDFVTVIPEEDIPQNAFAPRPAQRQPQGTRLDLNEQTNPLTAFLLSMLPWMSID